MLVDAFIAFGGSPRSMDMFREWLRTRFCAPEFRMPGNGVFIDAGNGCGLRDGRSQHSWRQLAGDTLAHLPVGT